MGECEFYHHGAAAIADERTKIGYDVAPTETRTLGLIEMRGAIPALILILFAAPSVQVHDVPLC
jgi:hypothetical protein